MSKWTPEAPRGQLLLFLSQLLSARLCCPRDMLPLSVRRTHIYTSATTLKYALLENSGAGTEALCSLTNSRHFTSVKKNPNETWKKPPKWRMPNPANTILKSSPCLCDKIPALCLGGTAARLSTPNLSTPLADSLLQLPGDIFVQGAC